MLPGCRGLKDMASYDKNTDDPAQHQRYVEYRALLDDELG
jgi:hypothetical protein